MKLRTLATTAAVSAALVAGGIAGPANAVDTAATGTIDLSTTAVAGPVYSTAVIGLHVNAGNPTVNVFVVNNGIPAAAGYIFPDAGGNVTVDLIERIERVVTSSGDVPAGAYGVYFTFDQTNVYSPDYSSKTVYSAATSATVAVSLSKLTTKISGYSAKTKKVKLHKKIGSDSLTVTGAGYPNTIKLQTKMKGAKKWTTIVSSTVYSFYKIKDPLKYTYGNAAKGKFYKRGTHYFRVLVPATPFSLGATSKSLKVIIK